MKLALCLLFSCLLIPLNSTCVSLPSPQGTTYPGLSPKDQSIALLIKELSPDQLKTFLTYQDYEYYKSRNTYILIGVSVVSLTAYMISKFR